MSKQCPQCRTMMNAEAPYCDACGCTFPAARVPQMALDLKAFIGTLVIFGILVVAILRVFAFIRRVM